MGDKGTTRQTTTISWPLRIWIGFMVLVSAVVMFQTWREDLSTDRTWCLLALVAFIAVLPFIGSVSEVSAFGVTAKLHEEVRRAEDALSNLRALAKVVGGTMLHDIATGYYFWDPKTVLDRLENRDRLLNVLREMGLSEADVADADAPARTWIAFWLHDAIREVAYENVPEGKGADFMREFDAMRNSRTRTPARPEQLGEVVGRYGALNERTKGWLASYSRFLHGGEVERREELARVLDTPEG